MTAAELIDKLRKALPVKEVISEAAFDHPCRETCAGWRQGYERGQRDLSPSINQLLEMHQVMRDALAWAPSNDFKHMSPDDFDNMWSEQIQAVEKIDEIAGMK